MIKNYACSILLLLLANNALFAQANSSQQRLFNQIFLAAEKEYGINQELINGVLFEKHNEDAIGHPYLLDYEPHQGSVIYRGRNYSNLLLNYDIFTQQVVLYYLFDTTEYNLYLQNEFITGFGIENKKFINESFGPAEDSKFYQVIGGNTPVKILYYWKKGLTKLDREVPDKNNIFSPAEKNTFLLLDNTLLGYSGNRSFTKYFKSRGNAGIKEYLRKNKIKVKVAEDHDMELLVEFINSLDI